MLLRFLILFAFTTLEASDIYDLHLIYNKEAGYEYSLPQNILESYLSGKAFDHPQLYSLEESEALHADINSLYEQILAKDPVRKKLAVITAGAPGAGKTVKMKQDLEACQKESGDNFAYIDPDDVCLKNQTRTYLVDIASGDGSFQARKMAYDKWRPGSNGANHLILANLIREGYAFYFGMTSTGPVTWKFFEFLKRQDYQIRLIHISAPDDVRWESIKERDKTFVQTTEQDIIEKGLLLPQRITDTYLKYADRIEFCYRSAVDQDAILAATWDKNEGKLTICNPELYEKITALHDLLAEKLQRPDLYWEASFSQLPSQASP